MTTKTIITSVQKQYNADASYFACYVTTFNAKTLVSKTKNYKAYTIPQTAERFMATAPNKSTYKDGDFTSITYTL